MLWGKLARGFGFRPVSVAVYGEWRDEHGALIPDHSFLVRVPRFDRGTLPALRGFIRREILSDPSCDQDCIYLSSRWRGEFVK